MAKETRIMAFSIKATPKEIEIIKSNAKSMGLPVTTYMRMVSIKGVK